MSLDPATQASIDVLEATFKADDVMKLLTSAKFNVEQLWKIAPVLSGNAVFALAIVQIRIAIKILEEQEDA